MSTQILIITKIYAVIKYNTHNSRIPQFYDLTICLCAIFGEQQNLIPSSELPT